jgi:hypothetical protein
MAAVSFRHGLIEVGDQCFKGLIFASKGRKRSKRRSGRPLAVVVRASAKDCRVGVAFFGFYWFASVAI